MSRKRNTRKPNTLISNNTTMSVQKTGNDDLVIVTIKRKCIPGEVNVNGCAYTLDSYEKALEKFNESGPKVSEIFFGDRNPYENFNLTRFAEFKPNCAASILDIRNNEIDYKISDEKLLYLLNNLNKENKLYAHMRYLGDLDEEKSTDDVKVYNIINIYGFDILASGDYPFRDYEGFKLYNEEELG